MLDKKILSKYRTVYTSRTERESQKHSSWFQHLGDQVSELRVVGRPLGHTMEHLLSYLSSEKILRELKQGKDMH